MIDEEQLNPTRQAQILNFTFCIIFKFLLFLLSFHIRSTYHEFQVMNMFERTIESNYRTKFKRLGTFGRMGIWLKMRKLVSFNSNDPTSFRQFHLMSQHKSVNSNSYGPTLIRQFNYMIPHKSVNSISWANIIYQFNFISQHKSINSNSLEPTWIRKFPFYIQHKSVNSIWLELTWIRKFQFHDPT